MWLIFAACAPLLPDSGGPDTEIRDTTTDTAHDSATDTDDSGDGEFRGIVVYWTLDTLGAVAAEEAGFCEAITGILAAHGHDLACVPGAVSPSSWTAPAHTRMLWPAYAARPDSNRDAPRCDDRNVLAQIADHNGGAYVIGLDNATMGPGTPWTCDDGQSAFAQHADAAWAVPASDAAHYEVLTEEEHALPYALLDLEQRLAQGGNVEVFLNSFEVGGHIPPRCTSTPDAAGCASLWDFVAGHGLAEDFVDDPEAGFASGPFLLGLDPALVADFQDDPLAARPMMWGSMHDAIGSFRGPMFEERLERLLTAVDDAGRQDDLVLVIVGDHGESPGQVPTNGRLNCSHGGQPNEWTALVPAYISPASLADAWHAQGLIGDRTSTDRAAPWWSTANLAYGLARLGGVPEADDHGVPWPALEPVGTATSWACDDFRDPSVGAAGIHLVGDHAARCQNDVCEVSTFATPADLSYLPVTLDPPPADVTDWLGAGNPFYRNCAVPPPI